MVGDVRDSHQVEPELPRQETLVIYIPRCKEGWNRIISE